MIPFGPYLLVQRLAVGGMSEVFLAKRRDDVAGRLVVVKRILPHLEAKTDFVQMFVDEARLTSRLSHRNLVRTIDFGRAEGVHFIALEYVDGLSLSGVLKRVTGRRLSFELSCWIAAEACAALAYAHERTDADGEPLNIVHRDISPDNLLLSRRGEVKLADFGIAKASTQLTQTRPGQLKGKFVYMSPEQGLGRGVDHRSDLFSIGLVLYEMTTGRRVFDHANSAEILRALALEEYTPPDRVVAAYPRRLSQIIVRALRWEPDQRYQQAATLREAVLQLVPAGADPRAELAALVERLAGDPTTPPAPAKATQLATLTPEEEQPTLRASGTKPGVGDAPVLPEQLDAPPDSPDPSEWALEHARTLERNLAALEDLDARDTIPDRTPRSRDGDAALTIEPTKTPRDATATPIGLDTEPMPALYPEDQATSAPASSPAAVRDRDDGTLDAPDDDEDRVTNQLRCAEEDEEERPTDPLLGSDEPSTIKLPAMSVDTSAVDTSAVGDGTRADAPPEPAPEAELAYDAEVDTADTVRALPALAEERRQPAGLPKGLDGFPWGWVVVGVVLLGVLAVLLAAW